MDQAKRLRELLRERVVFLDGASGTELMKRGMPAGVSTELWAVENTDTVLCMHRDYREAGADILLTCTFGGTGIKLGDPGLVSSINGRLAECALRASGGRTLTGASIGPTGSLLHPSGRLTWDDAYRQFAAQAEALVSAGIDIFFLETFSDPRELKAAVLAVRDVCPDGFISAQMTFETSGMTLAGTSPTALAVLMDQLPVDAVGANCGEGPEELLPVVQEMLRFSRRRVVAEPNAGLPSEGRWELGPERFAAWLEDFAWSGASILGGCCGTGPEHVREYVALVGIRPAPDPGPEKLPLLSSVDRTVRIGEGLLVAGESINPTGRRNLQGSIAKGDSLSLVSLARAQGRADLIDVNLGLERMVPDGLLEDVFSRLSIGPPLSVDLSDPEMIERAFRQMGGIAVLNSLTCDEAHIAARIGTLMRHGGYAVLLSMDGRRLGETPEERLAMVERGLEILEEFGLPPARVLADPVVRPVGTGADASITLETLVLYRRRGLFTMAGISNVSHGMPGRSGLNAALLSAMGTMGLDIAIADVLDQAILEARRGVRLLTGAVEKVEMKMPELDPRSSDPDFMGILRKSIVTGDCRQTEASARELLETGTDAREILNRGLGPAMDQVGDLYSRRKLFLPHLIASAEASRILTGLLAPHLGPGEATGGSGTVLLASVKGDIHDIGKNLVGMFLGNAGFSVTDLGRDVASEEIVRGAEEANADIVALSALMSTTAPEMEKVIALLREKGSKTRVLVGGAVVTGEFAASIGADGYAKDAPGAVREALRLAQGRT
ncbi:MAG: hypothetical protein AVO35_02305 [Candidatus Aegiribacteria sp. MLS_C]|nr:MAG: hypothetical protein AVO35_02305 [Candidatus Aegiribacteria sp. MLS_C]